MAGRGQSPDFVEALARGLDVIASFSVIGSSLTSGTIAASRADAAANRGSASSRSALIAQSASRRAIPSAGPNASALASSTRLATGASDRMSPRPSPDPGVRMAYVADPEGNLIELLDRTTSLVEVRGVPATSLETSQADAGTQP